MRSFLGNFQNVLADLAIEAEAAAAIGLRLARAYDEEDGGGHFGRLATGTIWGGSRLLLTTLQCLLLSLTTLHCAAAAISKYWVCKRSPGVAYEVCFILLAYFVCG